jgi:hypothetical protein
MPLFEDRTQSRMKETTLSNRPAKLPPRWRLTLLVIATVAAAALATISLLSQFNVNAILYKGF